MPPEKGQLSSRSEAQAAAKEQREDARAKQMAKGKDKDRGDGGYGTWKGSPKGKGKDRGGKDKGKKSDGGRREVRRELLEWELRKRRGKRYEEKRDGLSENGAKRRKTVHDEGSKLLERGVQEEEFKTFHGLLSSGEAVFQTLQNSSFTGPEGWVDSRKPQQTLHFEASGKAGNSDGSSMPIPSSGGFEDGRVGVLSNHTIADARGKKGKQISEWLHDLVGCRLGAAYPCVSSLLGSILDKMRVERRGKTKPTGDVFPLPTRCEELNTVSPLSHEGIHMMKSIAMGLNSYAGVLDDGTVTLSAKQKSFLDEIAKDIVDTQTWEEKSLLRLLGAPFFIFGEWTIREMRLPLRNTPPGTMSRRPFHGRLVQSSWTGLWREDCVIM